VVVKSCLEIWLDFFAAVAWPLMIAGIVFTFRKDITRLLTQISKLRVGDTEFAFQPPVPDESNSMPSSHLVDRKIASPLTESDIRKTLKDAGEIKDADDIVKSLQIFVTSKQTTWLVFSKDRVFCLLDDQNTRSSGRLIQWRLPTPEASPISARGKSANIGLLDIGRRKNWLYSTSLFPRPETLESEIRQYL
jgi:hypothetical protein